MRLWNQVATITALMLLAVSASPADSIELISVTFAFPQQEGIPTVTAFAGEVVEWPYQERNRVYVTSLKVRYTLTSADLGAVRLGLLNPIEGEQDFSQYTSILNRSEQPTVAEIVDQSRVNLCLEQKQLALVVCPLFQFTGQPTPLPDKEFFAALSSFESPSFTLVATSAQTVRMVAPSGITLINPDPDPKQAFLIGAKQTFSADVEIGLPEPLPGGQLQLVLVNTATDDVLARGPLTPLLGQTGVQTLTLPDVTLLEEEFALEANLFDGDLIFLGRTNSFIYPAFSI